jgi:2-C-methyl-D-erythritol 2,4-cyclodiphosphate synthase
MLWTLIFDGYPQQRSTLDLKSGDPDVSSLRVGQGYDVHRLIEGRPLVLGGVIIPHPYGLDGHSDADVLLHAIADALLGAAALGDIGKHFPNTDARFKDISSILLLKNVAELLARHGRVVVNIDATLILEQPKIAPFVDQMRQNIAGALAISVDRVSVKATTGESVGFIGRGEGAAALAVAMIQQQ